MPNDPINNALQDGTGFMLSPREALERLKERGYTHNISAHFDHFEADLGQYKIFSQDFSVDILLRFENASDPSDQAIMYAISSPKHQLKGVFLEPYGLDQEELSKDMLERLKKHFH